MSEQEKERLGRRMARGIRNADYRPITVALLIGGPLVIIVYDILPAISVAFGDTISELVRLWSLTWWLIPAGLGVLCGHFFGPFSWRTPGWLTLCALVPYGVLLIICGLRGWLAPRTYVAICIIFQAHFCIGAALWAQGDVAVRIATQQIAEEAT